MHLKDLGISKSQLEEAAELFGQFPDSICARVIRQDRDRFQVQTEHVVLTAALSGKFCHDATHNSEYPVVGDWIIISPRPEESAATIHFVLSRKGTFSRKVPGEVTSEQVIVSNIDVAFLVTGLDHEFNLRRIERYLTTAWNSGALPVIVLNKVDLADNPDDIQASVEDIAPGVDVIRISAREGTGVQQLRTYMMAGTTAVLLGSSGTGKSTIINALSGEDLVKTGDVREDDSRGRHTTTHREMIFLPGGGMIIDTPGMRELQLWSDENSIGDSFSEIEKIASECRFKDCSHESEPGCAVQRALADGELDEARFNSFLKLRKEVAYLDRRKTESTFELRKHDKSLGKLYKSIQQNNRKLK